MYLIIGLRKVYKTSIKQLILTLLNYFSNQDILKKTFQVPLEASRGVAFNILYRMRFEKNIYGAEIIN